VFVVNKKHREERSKSICSVKKKASYLHRIATTKYPCCVPTLGDSKGADRVGLARGKYTIFLKRTAIFIF